jgi:hypothetical protein
MAIQPTPTQHENDLAATGPYVMSKVADGSAADTGSPGGGAGVVVPPPSIATLTPTGGPHAGTPVTIDGSGFNVSCVVKIGATAFPTTMVSGYRVTATISNAAAGAQNLIVHDNAKNVDSNIKVFTFS